MDGKIKRGLGVRFNGSYSTISSWHGVSATIGNSLLGSRDISFAFSQRFLLSSLRSDGKQQPALMNHVSTIYNPGIIDGSSPIDKTSFQRPAL